MSSAGFAAWATAQKQACSRREKWALATGVAASSSWPTPTASDAGYMPDVMIGAGDLTIGKPFDKAETSSGQFSLTNAARAWTKTWAMLCGMGWKPGPISRSLPLVRVSFKFGTGSYIGGLISNPRFFEHAMGWPIGWTAPGEPVTAYAAWLRRSRTELSRLISLRKELGDDA